MQEPGWAGGDLSRAAVEARISSRFARMDADGDGRLTPADRAARRAALAGLMFDRLDADRDGSISRAEWAAAEARRGDGMPAGRRMQPRAMNAGRGGRGMALLAGADRDRDGAVTEAELRAHLLARFDRADADGNGVVTAAERAAARAARRGG
ncbi:hypothetical protein GVO57_01385 [Sphingomonas changnyeongensis]|uniref:EF-hand domain-containing protein n=1 Tax=Sphingomonas changnyeongensis TaxID=2698679 RepID=A0A7Z2NUM5_9SPHN|nr:hypothetical protein [Sphingomonas changnyeongensis]QHL89724.1 hypothetical protein GVO57_01385 [Sphingomonas changnyeongensis]